MRTLAALALLGLVVATPLTAAAESPGTRQIVQQRTADGSILLTDRPRAGATTERSWLIEREDPVAARQRAIDVKAEANLVAERIERRLAAQQRVFDEDAMRQRMARLDYERSTALDAGEVYGGGVLLYPTYRQRGSHRFRTPNLDNGRPNVPRGPGRAGRFTG